MSDPMPTVYNILYPGLVFDDDVAAAGDELRDRIS